MVVTKAASWTLLLLFLCCIVGEVGGDGDADENSDDVDETGESVETHTAWAVGSGEGGGDDDDDDDEDDEDDEDALMLRLECSELSERGRRRHRLRRLCCRLSGDDSSLSLASSVAAEQRPIWSTAPDAAAPAAPPSSSGVAVDSLLLLSLQVD